ncbi:MAG: LapA family protein [Rhodospirillaceae bacterium]|nr:LapA family protein [Rhodospirillaceae bacterium]
MRIINSIVAGIVAVLVVLFAVSNRAGVVVEVWPFPYRLALPLYALILLAVLLGFIAGIVGGWMMGGEKRKEHRRLKKQVRAMEQSLAERNDMRG